MTQATTHEPHRPPDADAHSAMPARRVIIACFLAIAVFIASIATLYVRWLGEDATALVVVNGDQSLADASVAIYTANERSQPPYLEQSLTEANNYHLRFRVPPGIYRMTVIQSGRKLLEQEVVATTGVPLITLSHGSATRPAAR